MPSCKACFEKAEKLELDGLGLVGKRERAPLLTHVGSGADGEIFVCPVCGDVTTHPKPPKGATVVKHKKGEPDE